MERTEITSSNIRSVGYDPDTLVLEIEFVAGPIYQCKGVPAYIFDDMFVAKSAGTYFAVAVKNKYPYERVKE